MIKFNCTFLILSLFLVFFGCNQTTMVDQKSTEYKEILLKAFDEFISKKATNSSAAMVRNEDHCIETGDSYCTTYTNTAYSQLYLPEYDCYVEVSFTVMLCINQFNRIDMFFKNMHIFYNNPADCHVIKEHWLKLYEEKRYNELDASKTKIDEYVSKLVEVKFMKEFMNLFLLEFDCEKEVFLVYANFFKSQCFLYCVKPVIIDGGRKVLFFGETNEYCGTACCKRLTNYCFNFQTKNIDQTLIGYEKIGPPCSNQRLTFCDEGFTSFGEDCDRDCNLP